MATPPPQVVHRTLPVRGLNSEELVTWSSNSMAAVSMATSSNTSNFTEDGLEDGPIEFYREAQIGFLVVILLMIVVGNAVVLLAIALSPERRMSRMNFFIMNLALADLLNGLLSVLLDLVMKITVIWYADNYTCKIVMYTRIVVTYASTYMLVSLSLDRLGAVARPMHFGVSRTRAKVLVATTWVLSLVFSLPVAFLFYKHHPPSGPAMCFIDLGQQSNWQIYLTLVATALFILPALIISICYVIIIIIIWRSSHTLKPASSKNKPPRRAQKKVLLNGSYAGRSESCSSSRGIIPQAKIRTIKMTFVIVLVFIVCWSPYFVFNLCSVYGYVPHSPGWSKVNVFVQSLGPLNSAANPIIYGIFSTRICRFLRRLRFFRKLSDLLCPCCLASAPSRPAHRDFSSLVTESEDLAHSTDAGSRRRVPLVRQTLTQADMELLTLHVLPSNDQ